MDEQQIEMQCLLYPKMITKSGYVKLFTEDGIKFEHIYIVEKYIGRRLTKEEQVHHCDLNKKNNKISNLWLLPNSSEHQKIHQKLKQFGWTQPLICAYNHRWDKYLNGI